MFWKAITVLHKLLFFTLTQTGTPWTERNKLHLEFNWNLCFVIQRISKCLVRNFNNLICDFVAKKPFLYASLLDCVSETNSAGLCCSYDQLNIVLLKQSLLTFVLLLQSIPDRVSTTILKSRCLHRQAPAHQSCQATSSNSQCNQIDKSFFLQHQSCSKRM